MPDTGLGGVVLVACLVGVAGGLTVGALVVAAGAVACRRAVVIGSVVCLGVGAAALWVYAASQQYSAWALVFAGAMLAAGGFGTASTRKHRTSSDRVAAAILAACAALSSAGVTLLSPVLLAMACPLAVIAAVGPRH